MRRRSCRRRAGFAVRLIAGSLSIAGLPGTAGGQEVDRAVDAAVEGGVILVCRHAMTDSFNEREPVDYDDPSTQRRLSPEGERQSVRIGRAWSELGIRVTALVSSPMDRAIRTAERLHAHPIRIDSTWHTNGSRYGGPARDARRRFLSTAAGDGVTVVVSHIGTMTSVLPEVRGRVAEGACVVVRPGTGSYTVVGVVAADRWWR